MPKAEQLGVVPCNARVDPALLPENEFPLHCAKCGYTLKALTGNRCPECGLAFEPGRRLVEQYYFGETVEGQAASELRKLERITGRVCIWLIGAGAVALAGMGSHVLWNWRLGLKLTSLQIRYFFLDVFLIAYTGVVVSFGLHVALFTSRFFAGRSRRRRVYAAWSAARQADSEAQVHGMHRPPKA